MVLSAKTLLRIAMALDLSWRPASADDHVTIRRDATIIEYDQIKESLYTALYDEKVFGNYELSIPAQYHKIILPNDQPATMAITKFSVDANRKKFEATIAAPSADNPIQHFQIRGKMHSVISVPVLLENLQSGHIIKPQDITLINIKERDFTKDTVADPDALIGMTARRVILAGRPIKNVEMVAPKIIERGELVTLSLNNGILKLSAKVKALENGAKGDVIRVVNIESNKTLHALVTGISEVTVVQN